MYLANVLPALAVLASAASTPSGQYIDANYDDITVVPAVPAANTLGTYKGLNYTGFATNQVLGVTGVAAHSKPNNIVSGVQQTATTGQNAGWSVASGYKYFDLLSLYYGCSANTVEGAAGAAQSCTFQVLGYRYKSDTKPVAYSQFSFTPKVTDVLAQPQKATFDKSFNYIQKVEVVQIESTSGEALNVIVFDDVTYNLYK